MGQEIEVITASRKIKRDFLNALSKDVNKYITEIVLNSDDSYKRIESSSIGLTKPIFIEIYRKQNQVVITDNAEGLSGKDFKISFSQYASDKSKANHKNKVRGMFGQGASDVMFSCAISNNEAKFESFKDGYYSLCKFLWKDDKPIIDVDSMPQNEFHNNLKRKYRILENGTRVSFFLPNDVTIPSKQKLLENLSNFYMLRNLYENSMREILVRIDEGDFTPIKRQPLNSLKLLDKIEFTVSLSDLQFECMLELYENPNKTTKIDEIIVEDETGTIFDNQLFGYENYPNKISGKLHIKGFSNFLRQNLNSENPLSILTDTRDGLDRRTEFYSQLAKNVEKRIAPLIKENNKYQENIVNIEKDARFVSIIKKINQYFKERSIQEIGGILPGDLLPVNGFAFAREKISITRNLKYSIKLYITKELFEKSEYFFIKISQSEDYISISPIEIEKDDWIKQTDELFYKIISIKAIQLTNEPIQVNAETNISKTTLLVNVIKDELFHPENGLEIKPKFYKFSVNKEIHFVTIYVDTKLIPIGSLIQFKADEPFSSLFEKSIEIKAKDVLDDEIAKIDFPIKKGQIDYKFKLIVFSDIYSSNCFIEYSNVKNEESLKGGLLSGIKLQNKSEAFWQTFLSPEGVIFINSQHPVTRKILNDLDRIDPSNPKFTKLQVGYISELISFECAKKLARSEENAGKITGLDQIIDFIQKEKNKMFQICQEILENN